MVRLISLRQAGLSLQSACVANMARSSRMPAAMTLEIFSRQGLSDAKSMLDSD
jgi:hypothetical protein